MLFAEMWDKGLKHVLGEWSHELFWPHAIRHPNEDAERKGGFYNSGV